MTKKKLLNSEECGVCGAPLPEGLYNTCNDCLFECEEEDEFSTWDGLVLVGCLLFFPLLIVYVIQSEQGMLGHFLGGDE
jgi:hypothetical protein